MTALDSCDPLTDGSQDYKQPSVVPNLSARLEQDAPVPEASSHQQKHSFYKDQFIIIASQPLLCKAEDNICYSFTEMFSVVLFSYLLADLGYLQQAVQVTDGDSLPDFLSVVLEDKCPQQLRSRKFYTRHFSSLAPEENHAVPTENHGVVPPTSSKQARE
ncbi:hypothetical protein Anapl_12828 [Anas platyrhynchos]|uniref:Uncharacterized protein n=1 Tax=Anas platyrhynchos TaxID=8839 RepID=R0L5H2_ANAPL|nr:hypothetical protein Anapl_12828 [Anas platyrhynchos]